jgi:abortive infection bacteriophage resistance protein
LTKQKFSKPASTTANLLAKLKGHGLVVADDNQATAYLNGVGAYRLKGYWHRAQDQNTKQFKSGFAFEDIRQHCELDREVRAATIEAIDRLEVAIRSGIADYLSLHHSPHWFLDASIFKPTANAGMGQMIAKIEREVGRAKEKAFIAHYFRHHDDPYLPPSWAIAECVSFGMWSRTFSILRNPTDKKGIAMRFGVDQAEVFGSWIHALAVLRNVAAHHSQLLYTPLGVAPNSYQKANMKFRDPKSFYAIATVAHFLLQATNLPHRWKATLGAIFTAYPKVSPKDLGFHPGWENSPGW